MTDQKPQPEPTLRERIAHLILGCDTMVREGSDPLDDALGIADALIAEGVTIASWEYSKHVTAPEGGYLISLADGPGEAHIPATHRRSRRGEWEPLPDGEEHEATSLVVWS